MKPIKTAEEILDAKDLHWTYWPNGDSTKERLHDRDCRFCEVEGRVLEAMQEYAAQFTQPTETAERYLVGGKPATEIQYYDTKYASNFIDTPSFEKIDGVTAVEMAEREYPTTEITNEEIAEQNVSNMHRREGFIKGYQQSGNVGAGWKPISEYAGGNVCRWHKIWNCPISVSLKTTGIYENVWIEVTLSHWWPDESFEPYFMPLPSPPNTK